MKSLWNATEAEDCKGDLLKLRVYTSRLLGREEDLVMHGGGNTSVKIREKNLFGDEEEILYVKGSGWDLATIEEAGFAPVRMDTLLRMAELEEMSDLDMVKYQRMAMTNPAAPNPSVEAVLHALIPYTFVDHTHADAVVTLSNTPNGEEKIREIYGDNVLLVPYVMPGFVLAQRIFEMTRYNDWSEIDGIILLNHGVFSFADDARESYEKMISMVSQAEEYLREQGVEDPEGEEEGHIPALKLAQLRQKVSASCGKAQIIRINNSASAKAFSELPALEEIAGRGPLTPDHIIRTKRVPLILSEDMEEDIRDFVLDYDRYFEECHESGQQKLNPTPCWAIWPGRGVLAFGAGRKQAEIVADISRHTIRAIHRAEQLGGWKALGKKDLFDVEYWSLEQEKLKKGGKPLAMQGKIALVTGAGSGIGKACVESLLAEGAVVAALDIDPAINSLFKSKEVLPLRCDVTNTQELADALQNTVLHFGGLDLLVSNAGIFPDSHSIAEMDTMLWDSSIQVNLTSHQRLIQFAIPYLELGIDPAIVIVGSKNVPAPGPGASAYSVAKAGLTQLGRIAALELGPKGIRVNMVHPNAVYDTAIWTPEVLNSRAAHYGLSVEEYKSNNVLKKELSSEDVARMVVAMLGKTFAVTTGAQIPLDGGNERVI